MLGENWGELGRIGENWGELGNPPPHPHVHKQLSHLSDLFFVISHDHSLAWFSCLHWFIACCSVIAFLFFLLYL